PMQLVELAGVFLGRPRQMRQNAEDLPERAEECLFGHARQLEGVEHIGFGHDYVRPWLSLSAEQVDDVSVCRLIFAKLRAEDPKPAIKALGAGTAMPFPPCCLPHARTAEGVGDQVGAAMFGNDADHLGLGFPEVGIFDRDRLIEYQREETAEVSKRLGM